MRNDYYVNADAAQSPYLSLNSYMSRTFGWMTAGLLVTFAIALYTAFSGLYLTLYSSMLIFATTIVELILVVILSARIQSLSPGAALAMFLAYSALNGLNLSVYFVVYGFSTLIFAFLTSALYFGVMAAYGAFTQKDLSGWGPKLMGGLIALIIGSVLGIFLGFGVMDLLLCAAGLVIFMCLTAYDTQKLKWYYYNTANDPEMAAKSSIMGALGLYLDFINIFLYVVRLLGRRRNN